MNTGNLRCQQCGKELFPVTLKGGETFFPTLCYVCMPGPSGTLLDFRGYGGTGIFCNCPMCRGTGSIQIAQGGS